MRAANPLFQALLLALILTACGGETSGPYTSTLDQTAGSDAARELDALDLMQPDIPDLSATPLEAVEKFHVKLTFPSVEPSFTSSSGTLEHPFVVVGGVVTPGYDSIYIRTDFADEPVPVEPAEDGAFTTKVDLRPPIPSGNLLEARPTTLWVVAQQGEQRVYDVAVVVANPGFPFPEKLSLTPDVLYAGEPSELLFTLDLNEAENFLSDQVWVMEVDASCSQKVAGSARQMLDNGQIDVNGDQIPVDRVYSAYAKLNDLTPGTHFFRAALTTQVDGQPLVAYSQCLPVRVVERLSGVDCASGRALLAEATERLDALLAAGWPLSEARQSVVAHLRTEPAVAEAGAAQLGEQVWVRFHSGLLGALQPTEKGATGATSLFHEDGVDPTVKMEPWSRQVVSVTVPDAENHPWQQQVESSTCPPWRDLAANGQLSLARRLAEAGVFFFAGRGGPLFGGLSDLARAELDSALLEFDAPSPAWTGWDHPGTQQVLWVDDSWSCEDLATQFEKCSFMADGSCIQDNGQPCASQRQCIITHGKDGTPSGVLYDRTQADLVTGRVVLGTKGLGVLPSFVARYAKGDLAGAFVWLGFPYSGESTTMAMEFVAQGANSVVVTTGDMAPAAAEKSGAAFFQFALAEGLVPLQILPRLGLSFADHTWRVMGSGNVDLTYAGLINPQFATGNLRGWRREGDARVLLDWCDAAPSTKYMAVVSNGLSYALDRGEISQEFCLTKDKLIFEAYYNFVSHEFMESCGTEFHEDRLELYMEDNDGQRVYLAATQSSNFIGINALCPCEAGDCGVCEQCGSSACLCGELYHPEAGEDMSLWPEECRFDSAAMGEAYASGWRHTGEVALTNFGQGGLNKPVRLVLRVSDESGLKGNTAVLVDSFILK